MSSVRHDLKARRDSRAFNQNSQVGSGSTGDPPVPSGHWPDGTEETLVL